MENACMILRLRKLSRRLRRKRKKKSSLPYSLQRDRNDYFLTHYHHIRKDPFEFFDYMKISMNAFDDLLLLLRDKIKGIETLMRFCISPEQKIVVTLRYLFSGCSFSALHEEFLLGKSTIGVIVRKVCKVINNHIWEICIPKPTEEIWLNSAQSFEQKEIFPHCIGALGGKCVRLTKAYGRYESNDSIVVLAICDSDLQFTCVEVKICYKENPYNFKNTDLFEQLDVESLNIPGPGRVSEGIEMHLPYVIAGDETFPPTQNLLCPFPNNLSQGCKKVFNSRLEKVHNYIDASFNILFNKWQVLQSPLKVKKTLALDIVKTCCILHNFLLERDGYLFVDVSKNNQFDFLPSTSGRTNKKLSSLRNDFYTYFQLDV